MEEKYVVFTTKGKNMEKKYEILEKCSLFQGTNAADIENLMENLHAAERRYPKGSFVLRQGDITDSLGILTEGALRIVTEDFAGNRNIISGIEPGELFCAPFASYQPAGAKPDEPPRPRSAFRLGGALPGSAVLRL